MKHYIIPVSFKIFNGETELLSDVYHMPLFMKDIKEVAKAMEERNGGHPVELLDAGKVADKIRDSVLEDWPIYEIPDLEDYSEVYAVLQEKMPAELIAAADEHIRLKTAEVNYYVQYNGQECKGTVSLGLKPEVFNTMVSAMREDHKGISDFDFLKETAPAAYAEIYNLANEWAGKEYLAEYGVEVVAQLREFPLQVFEYEF